MKANIIKLFVVLCSFFMYAPLAMADDMNQGQGTAEPAYDGGSSSDDGQMSDGMSDQGTAEDNSEEESQEADSDDTADKM